VRSRTTSARSRSTQPRRPPLLPISFGTSNLSVRIRERRVNYLRKSD